jgi:monosaccharide-transporting ATPase
MATPQQIDILNMERISKRFPGVRALDDVNFGVRVGEVHALIGGNGAGKSTLLKVLTGVHQPDGGAITFEGRPLHCRQPADAIHAGISTIYQEVNLVRTLTVAENLLLGRAPRTWWGIRWREVRRQARHLLGELGLDLDVGRLLGSYPVGVQQMVSIARAINTDARLIVMDEPTSSLDARETERFFQLVERLRERRLSVIFVTHFLEQIYRISDRITILRNGRLAGVFETQTLSRGELIGHMLGKSIESDRAGVPIEPGRPLEPGNPNQWVDPIKTDGASSTSTSKTASTSTDEAAPTSAHAARPTPWLVVRGLHRRGALEPVDLEIAPGEVLGVAGLLGSGRTELARLLFGADRATGGTFQVDGAPRTIRGPRQAIRLGMVLAPEDRQADGLIPELSVRENIVLARAAQAPIWRRASRREQRKLAASFVSQLGIVVADIEQPVGHLSGGNQQKVILARWLACSPRLLMLDEPTRGIDVGAKAEIEKLVRQLCRGGLSVLFISAELDEVARTAQRVLILRDRRPVTKLAGSDCTEGAIMAAIAGE